MNGRRRLRATGFTLFETLVVIVILSTIAVIAYSQTRQRQAASVADTFVALQAREMKIFGEAVQKFADANKASWTVGARQEITASQLVTAGHLPSTFAVRGGTTGATPIGETYRAFAIKDASNVARIVVADFGRAPTEARVRSAGYQSNGTSLQGYKARVAEEIVKTTRGFAGYVPTGAMTVRGVAGAFSQVLNPYFGNVAPTMPVTIELVGWPEYRLPDVGGPGPGGTAGSKSCNIVSGVINSCLRDGSVRMTCTTQANVTQYVGPALPSNASDIALIPVCPGNLGVVSTTAQGVALSYVTTTGYQAFMNYADFDYIHPNCYPWLDQRFSSPTSSWGPSPAFARVMQYQNIVINTSTVMTEVCRTETARVEWTSGTGCYLSKTTIDAREPWRVNQTSPTTVTSGSSTFTLNPLGGLPHAERGHKFYCTPAP